MLDVVPGIQPSLISTLFFLSSLSNVYKNTSRDRSVCLSACLSIHVSVCLLTCPSICLPIHPSIQHLFVHLSVYLCTISTFSKMISSIICPLIYCSTSYHPSIHPSLYSLIYSQISIHPSRFPYHPSIHIYIYPIHHLCLRLLSLQVFHVSKRIFFTLYNPMKRSVKPEHIFVPNIHLSSTALSWTGHQEELEPITKLIFSRFRVNS